MIAGKKCAAVVVAASLGVASLGGCAQVERDTGVSTGAQAGVLTGAAAGGVIAGLAGASPAWIAGSILLGGLVGGVIGDALTERDRQQHADTTYQAIENQPQGGSVAWNNPDSGNSGNTQIRRVYEADGGQACKDFTQTVNVGGEVQTQTGTACRQADGTWKVLES